MNSAECEFPGPEQLQKYDERHDEPTWRDVVLTPVVKEKRRLEAEMFGQDAPLRESPSYVYAGDSDTEETVYLDGPNGELHPSDELVAAVEAVLAKMHRMADGYGMALEDVETDLENALEQYRCRA